MSTELPLRDVHSAVAPDWWPPAPGWWVVLALVIVAIAMFAYRGCRRWRRERIRRRLRAELASVEPLAQEDPAAFLSQLAVLLKRLVIHACDRPELAGVHGSAWRAVLLEVADEDPQLQAAADAVVREQYRPPDKQAVPIPALTELARRWVERAAAESAR